MKNYERKITPFESMLSYSPFSILLMEYDEGAADTETMTMVKEKALEFLISAEP